MLCRAGRKEGDGWETKCCRDKRANRSAAHTPPQSRHYHNMTHLAQKTQQKKTKQSQRDKDNTNANTRHNMSVRSSKMNLIGPRVAKCHGYDGLIRVKILASWGKRLGEHTILQNEAFFGTDLHNLYEISLSKFYTLTESSTSVLQKYPNCKCW